MLLSRLNPFAAKTNSVLSGQTPAPDCNPKDEQFVSNNVAPNVQNETNSNAEASIHPQNGSSDNALVEINLNENEKKETLLEDKSSNIIPTNNNTNVHDTNQKSSTPIDAKPNDNTVPKTLDSNLSSSPNKFKQIFIDTPSSMVSSIITTVPATASNISSKIDIKLFLNGTYNSVTKITNFLPSLPNIPLLPFSSSNPNSNTDENFRETVLPPIDYENFLIKIHEPSAYLLLEDIQRFIADFKESQKTLSEEDQGLKLFNFMDTLLAVACPMVWPLESNEILWESLQECVEKFIMGSLYSSCFAFTESHLKKDVEMFERIASLQFITPKHLDIPIGFINHEAWNTAQEELQNINAYKCPREKLMCILASCKVIFKSLQDCTGKEHTPGVDDFLPVFIYVILKANPPCLYSNVQYLTHFRHPNKMVAESGYYFVSFLTAITFIESVDATRLSIDPTDFEHNMTATKVDDLPVKQRTSLDDLDFDESDRKSGDWVWLKRKGAPSYVSEKKLFDHLNTFILQSMGTPRVGYPTTTFVPKNKEIEIEMNTIPEDITPEVESTASFVIKKVNAEPVESPLLPFAFSFADKTADQLSKEDVEQLLQEYKVLVRFVQTLHEAPTESSSTEQTIPQNDNNTQSTIGTL